MRVATTRAGSTAFFWPKCDPGNADYEMTFKTRFGNGRRPWIRICGGVPRDFYRLGLIHNPRERDRWCHYRIVVRGNKIEGGSSVGKRPATLRELARFKSERRSRRLGIAIGRDGSGDGTEYDLREAYIDDVCIRKLSAAGTTR